MTDDEVIALIRQRQADFDLRLEDVDDIYLARDLARTLHLRLLCCEQNATVGFIAHANGACTSEISVKKREQRCQTT